MRVVVPLLGKHNVGIYTINNSKNQLMFSLVHNSRT
jgi:hypothetical protein